MAQKRKTKKAKSIKLQSLFLTALLGLFKIVIKCICWLSRFLYWSARRNPLYATGVFLFFISFGFISFNALFAQTGQHHGVFIETRPNSLKSNISQNISVDKSLIIEELDFKKQNIEQYIAPAAQPQQVIPANVTVSEPQYQQPVKTKHDSVPVPQQKPQKTNSQNLNLLDTQKKLAELGFYNGPLDGLDGPKTRAALLAYNQSTTNNRSNVRNVAFSQNDEIGTMLAPTNTTNTRVTNTAQNRELNLTIDQLTTQSTGTKEKQDTNLTASNNNTVVAQDIIKVQKALQMFGHDAIEITGKQDDLTTNALKKFQEIFSLNVTGQVNGEVLNKMKEIGLLS